MEIPADVNSADFYFDSLFADSSDSRYLKGAIIENERVVYDITLAQCDSVKADQASDFPRVFCQIFEDDQTRFSPVDLQVFRELGLTETSRPSTAEEYQERYQIGLIDLLLKTGRSGLIEAALKHKEDNRLAFRSQLSFVRSIIADLVARKIEHLASSIVAHCCDAEESGWSMDGGFEEYLSDTIRYFQDLDRVDLPDHRF